MTKDAVQIEVTSNGVQRFFVGAGSAEETRAGFRLLEKVVPEIRKLDEAIRREKV